MTKKKRSAIIIISVAVLLLILFVPFPKKQNIDDEGSAFTLNSLTYKVIFWNMYEQSEKPYNKTEFLFLPDNFCNAKKLYEERQHSLKIEGYGAVNMTVEVDEITDTGILVSETFNKSNYGEKIYISKDTFDECCDGISFEELKTDSCLKILYDGTILESYPATLGKIFKISHLDVNSVTTGKKDESNSENASQNNSSVQSSTAHTTASSENSHTADSVVEENQNSNYITSQIIPKPIRGQSSSESSSSQSILTPNGTDFYSQTMHCYNDYYDNISNIYIPYRVIEPTDYNPTNKYPVILFLHGAGSRFSSITSNEVNNLSINSLAQSFSFNYEWMTQALVIVPHISKNDLWNFAPDGTGSLDAAMRVFEKVTSQYSCDSNRYYVMGNSMGGYATWSVALKYHNVFAAAMPMCGWWNTSDAPNLTDIPIRIIHGTADDLVSVESSKAMYNAIKASGGKKVVLSLYEGADHYVWQRAFYDAETFNWLFAQKKQ